jgi:hypothetical protein
MDGKIVSMLYLSDQFPSAMVCLQNIRHYFISRGFELFNGTSIVPLSVFLKEEILIFLVHIGRDVVSEWVTQHDSYDLHENTANGSEKYDAPGTGSCTSSI